MFFFLHCFGWFRLGLVARGQLKVLKQVKKEDKSPHVVYVCLRCSITGENYEHLHIRIV